MNIKIQNGRLIDPKNNIDTRADVYIADGKIAAVGKAPDGFSANQVIDASGLVVCPGLIDLAARLREPGFEYKATLESEMRAAVAGGVTSLACPPDTDPPLDEPGLVEMLKHRAKTLNLAQVYPIGALTIGLAGEQLTEMAELRDAGCVGFSHADVPLQDNQVLWRALQYAATFGFCVWLRPQDGFLAKDGVAHDGEVATRLGLPGIPSFAETISIATIIELTRATGARVHLCRLSSAAGVELVRQAKRDGLPVSCDVSINSLHLTEMDMGYFDSRARLNPPLRQQRDREALRAALADGTIDVLVSDHTPVAEDAKMLPFAEAEPGATGMELLLSLALKWSRDDGVSLQRALAVLSNQPARVLGSALGSLQASVGRIAVGGVADLCLFDPEAAWTVSPKLLRSQSKHTPFAGYELPGRVRCTLVGGQVAFEA